MKKRIILSAVLFLAALANSFACTNLIVGKNASTDGSTIVSYSADSYGLLCMPLPMLFSILKPYKELLHV